MARIVTIAIALLIGACAGPQPGPPTGANQAASTHAITPALSGPFAYGVASGDMTGESVVLWTRTPGPATVIPELSVTPGFEQTRALSPAMSTENTDFTVKVVASGLQPGTKYYYRFRDGREVSPVGSFRTPYEPDQFTVQQVTASPLAL